MSLPVTDEEKVSAQVTEDQAGPTENLVSTACPDCGKRFVLLAHYGVDGWTLRCTRCGLHTKGELKSVPVFQAEVSTG